MGIIPLISHHFMELVVVDHRSAYHEKLDEAHFEVTMGCHFHLLSIHDVPNRKWYRPKGDQRSARE